MMMVINTPILRKGDKGEDVKRLQGLLNSTGAYPAMLVVDGDFGNKTDEAVKAFQKANGLVVDGICGAKTWAALLGTSAKETDFYTLEATRILELVKLNALASGIFPSVKAAQMILESDYIRSELAQNANNCFGMKTTLSGNTWSGSTWDGVIFYTKDTQEQKPDGTVYTISADFRKYPCIALNRINWKTLDWRLLKAQSQSMGLKVNKIFDANFGSVNSYHEDAWKAVYPRLVY